MMKLLKKMNKVTICLCFVILLMVSEVFAVNYTWTGATNTSWGTNTNWSPNGIPTSADNVTIVNTVNQPVLSGAVTVTNFTMSSGTLNLNSFTLTISGVSSFNSGTINNGTVSSTGASTSYSGTTFGANVSASCANVSLNGSTFNGTATITKTGTTGNSGSGGNTFNSTVTLANTGSGYLMTGLTNPDIFNGVLTISNSGTSQIYLAYSSTGTQFNNNILFNITTVNRQPNLDKS